jgi:hypothetical protein
MVFLWEKNWKHCDRSCDGTEAVQPRRQQQQQSQPKHFQTIAYGCIILQVQHLEKELQQSYDINHQLHQALVKEQWHVDTLSDTITKI